MHRKIIKIFLALSDAEFGNECNELGAFVGTLNNIYIKRNIFFELIKCEDLRKALETERRQDEFNEHIRGGQYFYLLFGKSAGTYAEEEFDVALEQFKSSGAPKIYTYFKQLPEGESAEKGVIDFKELKDGEVLLDKQPIMDLENVPLYCGNETLQQKKERLEKLNEEFAVLVSEFSKNPLEMELMDKMGEIGSERKTLQEEIHQIEMDMLEMCRETAQKRHSGMQLDWRERKAMELVDKGDYEGAELISLEQKRRDWSYTVEKIEGLCHRALDIYSRLYEKKPYNRWKWQMVQCYQILGTLKGHLLYYEEAEEMFREGCGIITEDMLAEDHENYRYAAKLYSKRAFSLSEMERVTEAEEVKKKSQEYWDYYIAKDNRILGL